MCIGYLKRQLLRRHTTRWAGEGPSLRSTGGLCCQGQWPGLDGIMAGPTRSVEIVSVQNIKHVRWSFTYWNLWLLHSFLDGNLTLCQFFEIHHSSSSSTWSNLFCMPFLFLAYQNSFCNRQLFVTYTLHSDANSIFFLQHKEEVEQLISPLSEKDCRVITQEAEIIILPSVVLPWACPQEVIWRTIRGRHSWGLSANLTLCTIICLFRRCTVSSLLWFRRISIWHDFFRSLSLVINIAAPNLRLTLYCKQYIMKQFFLPKKT